MSRRSWGLRRGLAISGSVLLLSAGCGARLTQAQLQALNETSNGSGTNQSVGISGGSPGTVAPAAGGATPGAVSASGGGAAVQTGGGQASSGAATPTVGGGSTSSSHGGTTSGGTPSSGGSAPAQGAVTAANSPLAGPGNKVCAPGAPSTDPGVTSSSITVGNIATINGPVPGLFAGARYGAQAVADYINSTGGLCGRKLVIDAADDQFDQATDQNEASSMANSVLAFMGSFSLQDAGIPAGAPNVPDVGETLSSQRFNSAMNFSPQPEPPGYHTGEYIWMKSSPRFQAASQKMALLVENTPQTATEGKYEEDALKSVGFNFIFTDTNLQPTDPTFNGDVQKMKSLGVQGVIFQATATIIGQLANSMYAAGMNVVLGNYSPSAYDPAYLKNAGPGAQGTVLSQALALYDGEDAASIPMVGLLDQWYNRVNPGQVPDIFATFAWMSGILLAQAINEGGAPTRTALLNGMKALTSFTADGLQSPANPATKTPPSCWVLIDVSNGKFVRDAETPSGFQCSPAGYFREPGA